MVQFASLSIVFHKGRLDIGKPTCILNDIESLQPIRVIVNGLLVSRLQNGPDLLKSKAKAFHHLRVDSLDECVNFGDLPVIPKLKVTGKEGVHFETDTALLIDNNFHFWFECGLQE